MTRLCVCARPPVPPGRARTPSGAGVKSSTDTPATVVLTLADTGGTVPFWLRVRRLLKYALRALGLRCVDMREETRSVSETQNTTAQRVTSK